ncbi:ATP-binding cassette sub- G member 2, partial [Rhizoclosmatium hyalinum]
MDHPVSFSPLRGNSANSGVTPSPKPNALSTFGSGRERSSSVTSRRHTSSTRSLLSITENQAEEEIEEPKHSISKSSSVIVMAQQSTRNLSASSKSCGGLSATGLSRMAFMSSKEALAVLGSNFQLNNIVPEEEEDEDCNDIHKTVELKPKGSLRSSVHILAHSSKSQDMKRSHLSEGFSFDDSEEDLISGLQDESPQTFSPTLSVLTPKRHSATTRNVSDDIFIPPPIIVTKDLSGGSISEIELAENVVSLKDRLQIVFEHLSLSAITKTNRAKVAVEKRVLNDAPGAGMTSLLHAIAAIKRNSQISGNVFVNGNLMQGLDIRQILGFIFEDDVICPTMTVKEAITMSSQLRMPNRTAEQHTKAIDQVIQAFGLTAVENTMIRYLKSSNGERKRCAIAIEVVTQPRILFLDRCTSGLDICSAVALIRILKELAKTGFTVVTTIRQPNSHIFHMFDEFLLMADGNIIFQGTPKTSLTYFSNLGFQCPKDSNPADYYLSTIINPDTESVYSCIEGLLN